MPTTAFAAIAALNAMLADVTVDVPPGEEPLQVVDGGPGQTLSPHALCVGWEPRDDLAADGRQSSPAFAAEVREETFTVALTGYTLDGDSVTASARDRMQQLYQAVEAVVVADVTLQGTVDHAVMGTRFRIRQVPTERGVALEMPFTVECTSYL